MAGNECRGRIYQGVGVRYEEILFMGVDGIRLEQERQFLCRNFPVPVSPVEGGCKFHQLNHTRSSRSSMIWRLKPVSFLPILRTRFMRSEEHTSELQSRL